MESYNDLIVRSTLSADDILALVQQSTESYGDSIEWEILETEGDVTVLHALAGSVGWEAAETAGDHLIKNNHASHVWGYLTHDEDPEALFFEQTADHSFQFVVSSAYYWYEEGAEEEQADHTAFDPNNPDHFSPDNRDMVGEPAYCWGCYERWTQQLPPLHRLGTYQELVESIVGPKKT